MDHFIQSKSSLKYENQRENVLGIDFKLRTSKTSFKLALVWRSNRLQFKVQTESSQNVFSFEIIFFTTLTKHHASPLPPVLIITSKSSKPAEGLCGPCAKVSQTVHTVWPFHTKYRIVHRSSDMCPNTATHDSIAVNFRHKLSLQTHYSESFRRKSFGKWPPRFAVIIFFKPKQEMNFEPPEKQVRREISSQRHKNHLR